MQASIAIAKKTPEQRLKLDIALALHLGPNYGKWPKGMKFKHPLTKKQ